MTPERASGRGAAKVILLGEHAVVHGARALATSLPVGVIARARKEGGAFQLTAPGWGLHVTAGDGSLSERAVTAVARTLNLTLDGLRIDVDTEVPARSGLGASAAIASAVARALLALNQRAASHKALFSAVQASESVFHGNPSGIDAALSLGGGVIVFSKARGVTSLPVSPPGLMIVHSGEPGDTRHTVARFANRIETDPEGAARRIEAIDELVERGIAALEDGDDSALGEIMLRNHEALTWFDVSSGALDRIVEMAMDAGALGAKMTGGGGGGCAVVLPGGASERVARRMHSAGFRTMAI